MRYLRRSLITVMHIAPRRGRAPSPQRAIKKDDCATTIVQESWASQSVPGSANSSLINL
jgi:hypothetical protein